MTPARYATQIRLPHVGSAGQQRLAEASVTVIGAGGLGSALLPLLAGAGVGRISIVDPDHVEVTNLHRQTLYTMQELGRAKAAAAAAALQRLNPAIELAAHVVAVDPANADAFVRDADIVVDAADRFAVSYLLSDACVRQGKPLVSGSAQALAGYVGVFCGSAPSYRAVFPQWPRSATSCDAAGVLGPVVATIGCLQAQLVLMLLLAIEPSPCARLWRWDAQRMSFASFDFSAAPEPEPETQPCLIAPAQIRAEDVVLDLRDASELATPQTAQVLRCKMADVAALAAELPAHRRVVLVCRSGLRAARAAALLQAAGRQELALVAAGDAAVGVLP